VRCSKPLALHHAMLHYFRIDTDQDSIRFEACRHLYWGSPCASSRRSGKAGNSSLRCPWTGAHKSIEAWRQAPPDITQPNPSTLAAAPLRAKLLLVEVVVVVPYYMYTHILLAMAVPQAMFSFRAIGLCWPKGAAREVRQEEGRGGKGRAAR
jgi:hypothetical protein